MIMTLECMVELSHRRCGSISVWHAHKNASAGYASADHDIVHIADVDSWNFISASYLCENDHGEKIRQSAIPAHCDNHFATMILEIFRQKGVASFFPIKGFDKRDKFDRPLSAS
jgi:hypothetical protein